MTWLLTMRFTLIILLSTQISFRSVSTSIMTYLHDRQQNNEPIWIAKDDTNKIWSTESASNGIVLKSSQSNKQLFYVQNVNLDANTAMFNLVGTNKYFCKNSDVSTTYSSSTSTLACVWTMYGEQARVGFQAENGKMCTSINFGGTGGTNYIRCPFTSDSWWNINSTTKNPTSDPTTSPSFDPSPIPTTSPSFYPSNDPTNEPSNDPTYVPTNTPSYDPTMNPTLYPSNTPTMNPTKNPTKNPTAEAEAGVIDRSTTMLNKNENIIIIYVDDEGGNNTVTIALIFSVVVVVLFLVIMALVIWIKKSKKKANNKPDLETVEMETHMHTDMNITQVMSMSSGESDYIYDDVVLPPKIPPVVVTNYGDTNTNTIDMDGARGEEHDACDMLVGDHDTETDIAIVNIINKTDIGGHDEVITITNTRNNNEFEIMGDDNTIGQ